MDLNVRGARDAIEAAITWEDVVDILKMQVDMARGGDADSAKLVLAYRLGKPLARMEHRGSANTPMKVIIEYVEPSSGG